MRLRAGLSVVFATFLLILQATVSASEPTINLVKGFGQVMKFREPVASVFLGSNEIAEVQAVNETAVFVSGLKPGSTNLLVMNHNNDIIRAHTIVVHPPNGEASLLMKSLIPRGSVSVRTKGDTAIIQGNADTIEDALDVLEVRRQLKDQNRLVIDDTTTTAAVQVALKVRIVELYRSDLLRLGFDITAIGKGSLFRVVTGSGIAEDFVKGIVGNAQGSFRAGATIQADQFDVNAMLDLLERRGVVEIIAEPMLTTTTGEQATFRSGGEFAIPVNQGDGVFTAQYKETGITIHFLPTILPNDRISIDVSPELKYVDPRSSEDAISPSLLVRSVKTKVQIASGQTFAIAGLYELTRSNTNSGAPGLSNLPLLGDLLTNSNKTREERELIFFITPYLVKASSAVELKKEPNLLDTLGFIVE